MSKFEEMGLEFENLNRETEVGFAEVMAMRVNSRVHHLTQFTVKQQLVCDAVKWRKAEFRLQSPDLETPAHLLQRPLSHIASAFQLHAVTISNVCVCVLADHHQSAAAVLRPAGQELPLLL